MRAVGVSQEGLQGGAVLGVSRSVSIQDFGNYSLGRHVLDHPYLRGPA